MGIEIERKFLLRDASWRTAIERSERMAQAYLGGDKASVRVRIEGDVAYLNIKSKDLGTTRAEFEYSIPVIDAQQILATLCGTRVEKLRHHVSYGGKHWEIDEFLGDNAGLLVAEIELEREDEPFQRPAWLGPETTHESRYYNVNLAREPFSQWPDRAVLTAKD